MRLRSLNDVGVPPERRNDHGVAGGELSAAGLFTLLWQALADVLGTAATATLVRRAAHEATSRWPELANLSITRENLEYQYCVPAAWKDDRAASPAALCALAEELCKLLVALTGSVVVNRLKQIPELARRGIVPAPGGPT